MPTTQPRLYKDTWKGPFEFEQFARDRAESHAPLIAGVECPASQFTFAVSDDGGENWRNPRAEEQDALNQAIIATGQCCQQTPDNCFLRT